MVKMFGPRSKGEKPEMISQVSWIMKKFNREQKSKPRAKKTKVRANGWFNKISENLSENTEPFELWLDDSGDVIEVTAFETQRNELVGVLTAQFIGDILSIENIEVPPKFRRNGVGTLLMKKLRESYPQEKIEPGLVTQDGRAFFPKMKQRGII
jgi:ribosomal protein S18 acetylase RimI-like enzyme